MKPLTFISLTALVLASVWIAQSPANNPDTLPLPELSLPLPQDQEGPQAAGAELAVSPAAGVSYEQQWVTQYVRSCNGSVCVMRPQRVLRWVAVQAAKPVRTARVLYHDGKLRTLELLRPIGAAVTCTRSTTQAITGEQWLGVDDQIYVRQEDGTWKPKRADARIPTEATISQPAVSVLTPIVTQRVSYTYPVMMTYHRARTPVFSRRCGPVRRLLGWCR